MCVLEHATIAEISGDACRSECVIPDRRHDAGGCSVAADQREAASPARSVSIDEAGQGSGLSLRTRWLVIISCIYQHYIFVAQ